MASITRCLSCAGSVAYNENIKEQIVKCDCCGKYTKITLTSSSMKKVNLEDNKRAGTK